MKVTIDGKEIELELTAEQLEIIDRAFKPLTGWERLKKDDAYYYLGFDRVGRDEDNEVDVDDIVYANANFFNSDELAENIFRAQTLQRKLWRRSAELGNKIDWRDREERYYIYYDYRGERLYVDEIVADRHFGQVYFDTEAHAIEALHEFRDELMWYFREFNSRMD